MTNKERILNRLTSLGRLSIKFKLFKVWMDGDCPRFHCNYFNPLLYPFLVITFVYVLFTQCMISLKNTCEEFNHAFFGYNSQNHLQ